mmetsp:Transcript_1286/g.5726  ORF Transcript_1286/g.5726 Transcript_1286/m.5726 type:complete len:323 (-) Transcript_1286:1706-2674(-)
MSSSRGLSASSAPRHAHARLARSSPTRSTPIPPRLTASIALGASRSSDMNRCETVRVNRSARSTYEACGDLSKSRIDGVSAAASSSESVSCPPATTGASIAAVATSTTADWSPLLTSVSATPRVSPLTHMFLHAVSVVSLAVRMPETVPPSEPPSRLRTSSSLGGGGDAGAAPAPPPGRNAAKLIPCGPPGDLGGGGAAAAAGGGGFVAGEGFLSGLATYFGGSYAGFLCSSCCPCRSVTRPRSTAIVATRPSLIPAPSPTPPLFARSRSDRALAIAAASVFVSSLVSTPDSLTTNSLVASSAADRRTSRSNALDEPIPVAV